MMENPPNIDTNVVVDTPVGERALGGRPTIDPRNSEFQIRALFAMRPTDASLLRRDFRYYHTGETLDQGTKPKCVGSTWRQWLSSAPIMDQGGPTDDELYALAQDFDEYTDTPPQGGSSTLGGVKAVRSIGRCASFFWAKTADEMAEALLGDQGTLCVGSYWFRSMSDPDPKTHEIMVPENWEEPEGGHEYFTCGYSRIRGMFQIKNSWGGSWGQNGKAWIAHKGMDRLLQWDGDACCATDIRLPKKR
jgi:hypothetical protein